MKRFVFYTLMLWIGLTNLSAQRSISGYIKDEKGEGLPYANIFIEGSMDGTSSDKEGYFSFNTSSDFPATLICKILGYDRIRTELTNTTSFPLEIIMKPAGFEIKEVEIIAGNFNPLGDGKWKSMNAVDVATIGGSEGDLYRSISTLPGNQIVGESGKLFIRGGESRESQTYIDDMHVLIPYTTTDENDPVRSRYSPFMFSGMTFSLGGYDPEYSQGLSSVLPLQTKDESPISKLGFNPSSVGAALGGTYAFTNGSASMNTDYQNLGPYHSLMNDKRDFIKPYNKLSNSAQVRFTPDMESVFKIYAGYDYTTFKQQIEERAFNLNENSYYLNSTYRRNTSNQYRFFAGIAYSWCDQAYENALVNNDLAGYKESEIHLKTKAEKRYSNLFKLQVGAESMIRYQEQRYFIAGTGGKQKINHSIEGVFATGHFYLTHDFNMALSSRVEYSTINKQWKYMPRIAFNYGLKNLTLSAIAGRYNQLSENKYLYLNPDLRDERCDHYIVSAYYQTAKRVYRAEGYYKKYDHLTILKEGKPTGNGCGYSKGIDLFMNDRELVAGLEYRLSYSLNLTEKLYGEFPVKEVPQYSSKHNASLCLRYNIPVIRSILSATNRFASGRPYHDPNQTGYMNGRTPCYNTLDLSLTVLAHKRVIIFASASNILNRKNIYNYTYTNAPDTRGHYQATAVTSNQNQFFYLGIFITLAGKAVYDVANF